MKNQPRFIIKFLKNGKYKFLNSSYSINQVKKNIPIIAKITCAINLNLDEMPDEFPFLIFLKSSKAPSKPKDKTIYKQNII